MLKIEKLSYLEDENGGFLCYEKDKEKFIKEFKATICFEGTKKEMEDYLKIDISNRMIFK